MGIRRDPIYVSVEVWRWLRLLAKAQTGTVVSCGEPRTTGISPDEIADQILRKSIVESHPKLVEHQKKIEAMERDLLKTL